MREQDRTLECGHSIYRFHKQVNLGERTWNDDLHAMSYSFGIAIVVLVAEQDVILQKSLVHGWNVVLAATMRLDPINLWHFYSAEWAPSTASHSVFDECPPHDRFTLASGRCLITS